MALPAHAVENWADENSAGERDTEESEKLTKPEDPKEAHEAKFTGSQRSHGALAEEIDNQS